MVEPALPRTLVAGTRGSDLARTQAAEAIDLLRREWPQLEVSVEVIRTGGDRDQRTPLTTIGGQGVFVKELEYALLDRRIDIAVHSLKDLPPRLEPGLALGALTARADPRDALVSRGRLTLAQLPAGARVGTGSARRRAALLRLRPDLEVVGIRGNVGTRIEKVSTGAVDAVVLAAAGLSRLGLLDQAAEVFDVASMIPAPGQGILGLEIRADDPATSAIVSAVNDPASHACGLSERAFLARLGSGCSLPVAAHAALAGEMLRIRGMIAANGAIAPAGAEICGAAVDAEYLGKTLAEALLAAVSAGHMDNPPDPA